MSSIFQHLRLSDPAPAGSDYQRDAKFMEELTETETQGILATLVDDNTKRRYLVGKVLPYWLIDTINISPYSPVGTQGAKVRSGEDYQKSVAAYQSTVSGREIQAIGTRYSFLGNEKTLAEGVVAGYENTLPFQVSHAGGTKWVVSGGRFLNYVKIVGGSGSEQFEQEVLIQELTIPGAVLRADKGFVGFFLSLESLMLESTQIRVEITNVSSLQVVQGYEQKMPLKTFSGTVANYSAGLVFCPIAYVKAASFGGPFIHPLVTGYDIRFGNASGWREDKFPGYMPV
jgi:hypothetical protein